MVVPEKETQEAIEALLAGRETIPCDGAWFHAQSEDMESCEGPFATREEAIEAALDSGLYDEADEETAFAIGTGEIVNFTLSIDAERVIEHVDEWCEGVVWFDEPWRDFAGITAAHEADLQARLRRAMAEWLVANSLGSYVVSGCETVRVPAKAEGGEGR